MAEIHALEEQICKACNWKESKVPLLPLIETAFAVENVYEIAKSSRNLIAICMVGFF